MALRLLEDAASDARLEPINRTLAHRLALAWFGYVGVAKPWQIEQFWDALGTIETKADPQNRYCRELGFSILLRRWRTDAGLPERFPGWPHRDCPAPAPQQLD